MTDVRINFNDVPGTIALLEGDGDVEKFLFDALERRFGHAKLAAARYEFFVTLPAGYRVIVPTVWLEGETANGGICQFFWNCFDDHEPICADAVVAYEEMGAVAYADAVRSCVNAFQPHKQLCGNLKAQRPRSRGLDLFDMWEEHWTALNFQGDHPLFEFEEITRLYRVPWIRRHAETFVFPPT